MLERSRMSKGKRPVKSRLCYLHEGLVMLERLSYTPTMKESKNRAAQELGRLGGLKGGKARAAKLTAEQRTAIARKAAESRWVKREAEDSEKGNAWKTPR
jgi:hypothetical protein